MLIEPEKINSILNLAETRVINKGKKYYEQNRVSILSTKIVNKDFEIQTIVNDTDTYNYFINIKNKSKMISYNCDCKEHLNNGALCPHIIASLFDIYIEFEKYISFKNLEGNNSNNIIYSIEDVSKETRKIIPAKIDKKDFIYSIQNILNKKEGCLNLLCKLIYDFINRADHKKCFNYVKSFINNKDKKIKIFDVSIKNPEIRFEIEEKKGRINIITDFSKYEFFIEKDELYYIYEDKLYKTDNDVGSVLLPYIIVSNFTKSDIFYVENVDKTEFFKYGLFYLENLNIKIEKSDNISLESSNYNIGTKYYFDIDEKENITVAVKLVYENEEYELNLEKKSNESVRNLIYEEKIKRNLINLGFRFDNKINKIYIDDEDKKYEFLKKNLNDILKNSEIFYSQSFKKKKVNKVSTLKFNFSLVGNLIQVDLANFNISASQLKKILDSYKLKKKFFKLNDGTYIDLENENEKIDTLKDIYSYNEKMYGDRLIISKEKMMYLDSIFYNDNYDEKLQNYMENLKNININKYEIPTTLNASLRNYQIYGYNWIRTLKDCGLNGILADDMGLGKTLQLITVLENERIEKNGTSIVVCPSSLYLNWQKEIYKFAPNLKCLTIYGNASKRENLIKKLKKYDVIITSYDILKRDIDKYVDFEFNYIIADEAQYIKNHNTKNAKAIKALKSKNRIALTGTPMENSLSELWSIFDFLMPGFLFSYTKFREKFEKPIILENNKKKSTLLKNMITPFILRRMKKDVLKDLPKKTETFIYNKMTDEQQKVYDTYLLKASKELREELEKNGVENSQMKILAIITRLRQICCHPKLFIDNYEGNSAKLLQCIELIKDMIESNHKILLFSGFASMFEIIEKELKKNNIDFYKLEGTTKSDKRIELVEKFNEKDDVKVFLVSLKAGGTGLNLIGADVVMHFDPWWNLSSENQATDRTYRIGQKKNVEVFKYITENSIEEKIELIKQKKKELADLVLTLGTDFMNKLTKEEILELLKK